VIFADGDLPLSAEDARYLLTRSGFQPDTQEVRSLVGVTRSDALEALLAQTVTVATTTPPDWVELALPTRAMRKAWTDDQRRAANQLNSKRYDELRAWWLHEMVVTPSPLTERMTLFWHNHFTSAQDKVPDPQVMYRQHVLLRRYALDRFDLLLHTVSKDPAMLLYLDGANSRKEHPNENFAREVMELFTLGEGHYSEDDVKQAARAYTGWSVDPDTGTYLWRPAQHDDGVKTVLGQSGAFDGDQMLDILLAQPQTADFVSAKLWREFISTDPDPMQLAPISHAFRASGYDIRVALRGVLSSPAFWDPSTRGTLVKSPAEFVVGTVRQFSDETNGRADCDPVLLERTMRQLGQVLFAPPNVKGWPGGDNWIDSATLLARKQFVEQCLRATDAKPHSAAMADNGTMQVARKTSPAGMTLSAPTSAAVAGMKAPVLGPARAGSVWHFDLYGWLAQFELTPQDAPALSQELQMQHAILPIAAVDPIPAGASSTAYLQALLMDPAYQLK